jgi:hypothetical protein
MQVFFIHPERFFVLIETQQSVIYKDARLSIAECLMNERRRHRRINAA